MESNNRSSSHAVFNIKLHIVFVTKYRRKTLTPEVLEYLKEAFAECLAAWRCKLGWPWACRVLLTKRSSATAGHGVCLWSCSRRYACMLRTTLAARATTAGAKCSD